MQYADGRKINVGDRVELWSGSYGLVVCSVDDKIYTNEYPEVDWGFLASGVLVKMDNGELMHYSEKDFHLKLLDST